MNRLGLLAAWVVAVLMLGAARPARAQTNAGTWEAGVMLAMSTNGTAPIVLPLKHTDVRLRLIAGILSATVTQAFSNDTTNALEAVYLFPLPSRAAVTEMELRIGDRRIRSVVQEAEEAKATYEAAKSEGKAAALMEEERPNLFRTSVANFLPGEEAAVTFTYTEPAHVQGGIYGVTFPMVVGQRYFPAPAPDAASNAPQGGAQDINPPVLPVSMDPVNRVTLMLEVFGMPVERVVSSTHALTVAPIEGIPGAWRATPTDGDLVANGDFHAEIEPPIDVDPVPSWVTASGGESQYGLLTVFPPLAPTTLAPPARDVVFLIDTSGSMEGDSIQQARQGLSACLRMLRPEDRFNIVRFSDDFSSFAPVPVLASPDTLDAARAYIAALTADGGTEMQPALEHILDKLAYATRLPMIVFMTDGCVGNEATLMQLIHAKIGKARLFTFGIGSAPNEYLMRKVAELGRGQSRFIRAEEDVGLVMADFFRTLASATLTDVKVEWLDGFDQPLAGAAVFPAVCPDVFIDRPLQLVGEFREMLPTAVRVSGLAGGEPRSYRYALGPSSLQHALVGRLYGQARVDEWLTDLQLAGDNGAGPALKQRIIATALQHQLVTPFTSRVAVEERVVRNPDGSLQTVNVPTPPPAGWAMFAPTASADPWLLLAGALLLAMGAYVGGRDLRRRACRGEGQP